MQKVNKEPVIEATRSGVRGRIDRLAQEYLMKHQALRIAAEILDEDDRRQALESAPRKFLQAMNLRQSHLPIDDEPIVKVKKPGKGNGRQIVKRSAEERLQDITDYLRAHPGAKTGDIAKHIGIQAGRTLFLLARVARVERPYHRSPGHWFLRDGKATSATKAKKKQKSSWSERPKISGSALTLFLLDHLDEERPTSFAVMGQHLAEAGSPIKSLRVLNGTLAASFKKQGLAVKDGDGYVRTPKGSAYRVTLRETLEANGSVSAGGYGA